MPFISVLQDINAFIIAIGIPAIVGALIYIGRKLQILDILQADVATIKHNLNVVTTYLIKTHTDFDHKELKAMSPMGLTQEGTAFIREVGFEGVFHTHQSDFFACIDMEHPTLKYDVEIAAIKSIYALSDKDYMRTLKVFLYNHPSRTLENVAPTLGIYVRDKYLEVHPEITQ